MPPDEPGRFLDDSQFNLLRADLSYIRDLTTKNAQDLDIIKSSLPLIMKAVSDVDIRLKRVEDNPCPRADILESIDGRLKRLEDIHPELGTD